MSIPSEIPILDLAPELSEVSEGLEAAWRRVLASGHFILGPEVEAFEREVAEWLGARHAVGVNSGTDALVIALRALGIGPGDEVVTTPFSFFATAESISAVGATPVFADIDRDTFNLRPDLVERAITPRTRAILPVHLFGLGADMAALSELARRRGLAVVEDVAQAFGGTDLGRKLGTIGAVGAFSFFPSKNLGCMGDGGLIATDDERLASEARMLRAHGSRRKYFNEALGYNSRLDALQAAILRTKLPRVEEWNRCRAQAAARYRDLLRGASGISLPVERPGARHVYHQFTLRVTDGRRDALRDWLAARGIGSAIYYPRPLHQLPLYAASAAPCPEAEAASQEVLSLPLWPRIPAEVQQRVAGAVRAFLEQGRATR